MTSPDRPSPTARCRVVAFVTATDVQLDVRMALEPRLNTLHRATMSGRERPRGPSAGTLLLLNQGISFAARYAGDLIAAAAKMHACCPGSRPECLELSCVAAREQLHNRRRHRRARQGSVVADQRIALHDVPARENRRCVGCTRRCAHVNQGRCPSTPPYSIRHHVIEGIETGPVCRRIVDDKAPIRGNLSCSTNWRACRQSDIGSPIHINIVCRRVPARGTVHYRETWSGTGTGASLTGFMTRLHGGGRLGHRGCHQSRNQIRPGRCNPAAEV